jgi:tetratricopeptide (TPR) repeat protein
MKDARLGGRDAKRYLRRAELLLRDGKFEEAVTASTEAVALFPSALGHLYRGRSYLGLETRTDTERSEVTNHEGLMWVWSIKDPIERRAKQREVDALERKRAEHAQAALRDYTDAVLLADSVDLERQIRFERLRQWRREDDYEWLEANTRGHEAGKLFYYRTLDLDENDWLFQETTERAEANLRKALELGYDTAGVHYLLAQVQLTKHNIGMAFEQIELAIEKWESGDRESEHGVDSYRALRAMILWRLGSYDEALQYWYERVLLSMGHSGYADLAAMGIEVDILSRYAIAFSGGSLAQGQDKEGLQIIRVLSRHIPELRSQHPRCAEVIEDLLKRTASSR